MPTVEGAPDILNIEDDLIDKDDLAKIFGIAPITLDAWRWGREGKPMMPFVRLGNRIVFSKTQMTWWLNTYQKQVDPYHEDRVRRKQEGIRVAQRRKS
jgi:hypothetical protein